MSSRSVSYRPNIFSRDFITNILSTLDPTAEISDEAKELATNVAYGFVDSLTNMALEIAKLRNSEVLDICDFQYVLSNVYGINLLSETTDMSSPTSEYQDMMCAVEAERQAATDED